MLLMGKLNNVSNCVAILPVLNSGYQTLAFFICSIWGLFVFNPSNMNIFQVCINSLRRVSWVSHKFQDYFHFSDFFTSFIQIFYWSAICGTTNAKINKRRK